MHWCEIGPGGLDRDNQGKSSFDVSKALSSRQKVWIALWVDALQIKRYWVLDLFTYSKRLLLHYEVQDKWNKKGHNATKMALKVNQRSIKGK